MQVVLVAILILVAVLVGAAVPVLVQLRSTLRSAQAVLDQAGPRLEKTLTETTEAMERLNHMASEIEEKAKKAEPILDAALDIGNKLARVGGSLRTAAVVGTTVAPAVTAAFRAIFKKPNGEPESPESEKEEAT